MQLRPLRDWLVVDPVKQNERGAAAVFLLESAGDRSLRGIVLAVGPGARRKGDGSPIAMDVSIGNMVLVVHGSGIKIKFEDRGYLVFRESDVLAIVD